MKDKAILKPPHHGRRSVSLRAKVISLLLFGLLLAQPAAALSYPITIQFGRSWPLSVVVDSNRGLAYADGTSGENPPTGFTFGVINLTSHELVKVLPLDEIPGPVALDPSNGDVYVAGNYSIAIFDQATQNFSGLIEVGHPILYMIYDGNVSGNIFVTAGDGVYAFNPQTGAMTANATVSGGLDGMVVDPSNGMLYVSEYTTGEIAVFNPSNLEPAGVIELPTCCASMLALNSNTQMLYASTGTGYVDVINVGTNSFEKTFQVAPSSQNSTNAIVADDETGRVYVASSPGGSVLEIDGSTGTVLQTLKVPGDSAVAGLALDTKTGELYATNYHQLTVFDAGRGRGYLLLLVLAALLIVASVVIIVGVMKWRESRERKSIQSGLQPKDAERIAGA